MAFAATRMNYLYSIMEQTKYSLDKYAKKYNSMADFDRYLIDFRFRCLKDLGKELGEVLELGCANGLMSKKMLELTTSLDIVEGSGYYISETKKYLGDAVRDVRFFNDLFEDYRPDKKYDTVVLSSILHEVAEPQKLLLKAKEWMKEDSLIYINVPNAQSLHRRVGRILGLL